MPKKLLEQPPFDLDNYGSTVQLEEGAGSNTLQTVGGVNFSTQTPTLNDGVSVVGNKHTQQIYCNGFNTSKVYILWRLVSPTGSEVKIKMEYFYDPSFHADLDVFYYPDTTDQGTFTKTQLYTNTSERFDGDFFTWDFILTFLSETSASIYVKCHNAEFGTLYEGTDTYNLAAASWNGGYYVFTQGQRSGAGQTAVTIDNWINNTYGTTINPVSFVGTPLNGKSPLIVEFDSTITP